MRQRGIGLRAGGQQFTDARHAIRAGQHGPIVAPAHALQDGFEVGFQADHRAARGQRLTVGWIDHSAAARGDHKAGRRGHLTADRGFQRPESRLAILREDLRDGFAGALHDQIVQVNERTSRTRRHFAADSGLAGAHEAGEDDVGDWKLVAGSWKLVNGHSSFVLHPSYRTRIATPHYPSADPRAGFAAEMRSAATVRPANRRPACGSARRRAPRRPSPRR